MLQSSARTLLVKGKRKAVKLPPIDASRSGPVRPVEALATADDAEKFAQEMEAEKERQARNVEQEVGTPFKMICEDFDRTITIMRVEEQHRAGLHDLYKPFFGDTARSGRLELHFQRIKQSGAAIKIISKSKKM